MPGKYDPLEAFLAAATDNRVTLTVGQVEALVGALPPSALEHAAWWSNEADGGHVQAQAWVHAGWNAKADQRTGKVTFTRH